ncbi:MAG: hypothetical protein ABL932_01235 [Terricaulis sp.]
MGLIIRLLVGLAGLLALVLALGFWINPDMLAMKFGIAPQGPLGFSTLRADFGALFAGTGALAIAAALRNNARLITAPLLLIGFGFSGRLLTIALSGYDASMLQPMIVEIVLIAIFAAGRKVLPAN